MDDSWRDLDKVIKTNSPLPGDNRERMVQELFTRGMHNNAQAPANTLSRIIDFKGRKHLLDIGGGSGAFSIILTNKFEWLKATVIEQPHVTKLVREYVDKEGDIGRVDIVPGDYFKLEFPPHDMALLAQIFHSNSTEENILLLKKVYEKMEDGGMVMVTEFLLDEDGTGPLFSTIFNLNMLKQTEDGRTYTFSQIKSWLVKTDFKSIEKQNLAGPHTLITAVK